MIIVSSEIFFLGMCSNCSNMMFSSVSFSKCFHAGVSFVFMTDLLFEFGKAHKGKRKLHPQLSAGVLEKYISTACECTWQMSSNANEQKIEMKNERKTHISSLHTFTSASVLCASASEAGT